jgi:hypothetical protein
MSIHSLLYSAARLRRESAPDGDAERWVRLPRGGARQQIAPANSSTAAYPSETERSCEPDKWSLTSTRPYGMHLVAKNKRGYTLQRCTGPPPVIGLSLLWRVLVGPVIPPDRRLPTSCAGGASVGRTEMVRRSTYIPLGRQPHFDDWPPYASGTCAYLIIGAVYVKPVGLCDVARRPHVNRCSRGRSAHILDVD